MRPRTPCPASYGTSLATSSRAHALATPDRLAAIRAIQRPDVADEGNARATLARLVRLATALTGAPLAVISRVDVDRDCWLATAGLPEAVAAAGGTDVRPSFCEEAVVTRAPIVTRDALADPHFRTFPAVVEQGVRACLAVPLVSADGQALGNLCVLDLAPHDWTDADVAAIGDLAAAAVAVLERGAARAALHDLLEGGLDSAYLLRSVRDDAGRVTDFAIVDCNTRAAEQLGTPRAALVGLRWHETFSTPRARHLFAAYTHVVETGEPCEAEFEVTDPRVDARWLRVQAVRVGDGVALTVQNVTERKAAEAALLESEARHRVLLESLPVLVYRAQPEPPYAPLYVSQGALAFGYSIDEWLTSPDLWVRLLHPDDRQRVLADTHAALAAGTPVEYEYRVVAKDGTVHWMHDRGDFVRDDAGRAVAWQGIMLDVTARRAAEAALRESETRLRLALGAANDGLWDWHVPSGASYYSPRWTGMLGYAPDELPARYDTFLALLHPDDAPRVAAAIDAVLTAHLVEHAAVGTAAGGPPAPEYALEFRLRAKDGSWRWVLARGDVVERDAAGVPVRMAGTHVDLTERKALEAALVEQATHDALTGLANRDHFRARVDATLATAAEDAADVAEPPGVVVLFLDLDDFKAVNDSLGHAAGDALLQATSGRLLNATRGCDMVARLGGDEFAVLLEHVGSDAEVAVVAERVATVLSRPFAVAGREVRTPASVGIARARPGESADDLLRNADLAMYRAKGQGKGRVAEFAPAMHAAVVDRMALAADLRRVTDWMCESAPDFGARDAAGEFVLVYQPIVALPEDRITGAEALFRWRHPTRGLVSPAECIPLAEETGLIVPIGRWVLEAACREGARWDRSTFVSVNVSARQLQQPTFVDDVTNALAAAGLPAGRLVIEITEGVLMQRTDETLARLHALKALGVRLAVDDFGTGYSSLAYLQRFPLDVLKLDKAFVDPLARGGPHVALARTVLALGDSLGLRCVAEGVETAEQRAQLVALGCGWGQGYLFARPLSAEAMRARLAAQALAGAPAAERTVVIPARAA